MKHKYTIGEIRIRKILRTESRRSVSSIDQNTLGVSIIFSHAFLFNIFSLRVRRWIFKSLLKNEQDSGDTASLMRVSTVLAEPIVSNLSKSTVHLHCNF